MDPGDAEPGAHLASQPLRAPLHFQFIARAAIVQLRPFMATSRSSPLDWLAELQIARDLDWRVRPDKSKRQASILLFV